jgi:hypothetical protein
VSGAVVSTAKAAAATKAIFIIGASFLSSITDNVDEHERFHPVSASISGDQRETGRRFCKHHVEKRGRRR